MSTFSGLYVIAGFDVLVSSWQIFAREYFDCEVCLFIVLATEGYRPVWDNSETTDLDNGIGLTWLRVVRQDDMVDCCVRLDSDAVCRCFRSSPFILFDAIIQRVVSYNFVYDN